MIFQKKDSAHQFLKRQIKSNEGLFEEFKGANLERECIEQACRQEEFMEAYSAILNDQDSTTNYNQFQDYVQYTQSSSDAKENQKDMELDKNDAYNSFHKITNNPCSNLSPLIYTQKHAVNNLIHNLTITSVNDSLQTNNFTRYDANDRFCNTKGLEKCKNTYLTRTCVCLDEYYGDFCQFKEGRGFSCFFLWSHTVFV